MSGSLTALLMKTALHRLDELVTESTTLIVGGGGAMILAHGFPLATSDLDAIPRGTEIAQLDVWVKQIAEEQSLPPDWLSLLWQELACTRSWKKKRFNHEMFRSSSKDVGHARALLKKGADTDLVETHIEQLRAKGIPGTAEALSFLNDLLE